MLNKGMKLIDDLRLRAKWGYGDLAKYFEMEFGNAKKLCESGRYLDAAKWCKAHDLWVALGGSSSTFVDALRNEASSTDTKNKRDPMLMLTQLKDDNKQAFKKRDKK